MKTRSKVYLVLIAFSVYIFYDFFRRFPYENSIFFFAKDSVPSSRLIQIYAEGATIGIRFKNSLKKINDDQVEIFCLEKTPSLSVAEAVISLNACAERIQTTNPLSDTISRLALKTLSDVRRREGFSSQYKRLSKFKWIYSLLAGKEEVQREISCMTLIDDEAALITSKHLLKKLSLLQKQSVELDQEKDFWINFEKNIETAKKNYDCSVVEDGFVSADILKWINNRFKESKVFN